MFVAKKDGKVVGFLYGFMKKYSGFFASRLTAHVSDIVVAEEFRSRNIGKKLMEKFEIEFAKSHKADEISLNVSVQNVRAINFYRNLGYDKKLVTMRKRIN